MHPRTGRFVEYARRTGELLPKLWTQRTKQGDSAKEESGDVKRLYTEKVDTYLTCNSFFRYSQSLRAFFDTCDLLRPGLRILDAGCGTGTATFALADALQRKGFSCEAIDGFDLTPAMLDRFRKELERRRLANVHLVEANVLELERLPPGWSNYDLVISAAMLDYVPRAMLPRALQALRDRLAPTGQMLLFISRKTRWTTLLIERYWRANRYTRRELRQALEAAGFTNIDFQRFPEPYFWQNIWGHVILVRAAQKDRPCPQGCR